MHHRPTGRIERRNGCERAIAHRCLGINDGLVPL
jgi:hypothetical protein